MRGDEPIRALPNLGLASERMLARAGIASVRELRRIGAVEAFLQVEETRERPSLNLLWALEGALEGALRGWHWAHVARTERARLPNELEAMRALRALDWESPSNRRFPRPRAVSGAGWSWPDSAYTGACGAGDGSRPVPRVRRSIRPSDPHDRLRRSGAASPRAGTMH